jgi:AcrR family transcriptional regulator
MPRRSEASAAATRSAILARAVDLGSVEGLSGLTIGRLADAISMSKSGLFAHFGSKEELQLAVVETAREIFEKEVIEPAEACGPGMERLIHLAGRWLSHMESAPLRGGCFFAAVSLEVDDRPGRVRDRVAELTRGWQDRLATEARQAIDDGLLREDADPAQIAFEIHAFVQEANRAFQLHGEAEVFRRAARAIRAAIAAHATKEGLVILAAEAPPT